METPKKKSFHEFLIGVDRRVVYVLLLIALIYPLLRGTGMQPAKMTTAQMAYDAVEKLTTDSGKMVWVAMDWGPATQAENMPQTAVFIEHLMRRKIAFCTYSISFSSEPFMKSVPQGVADRLNKENEEEGTPYRYEYAKDWVNIGFRPAAVLFVRGLAKTDDVGEYLSVDVRGTPMSQIPCMKNIKTIQDFIMLAEFTGWVGAFNIWVQFFQTKDYKPIFVHGCTSITIPEAFIYLDSKQIHGLFEGVAGAAYYSKLIQGDKFDPVKNPDLATKFMMSLSMAHLVIILFIIISNIGIWMSKRQKKGAPS